MTLAQDAFINKVRCLPSFLPPSRSALHSIPSHRPILFASSSARLTNIPSLPPSLPPQVNDPAKVSATVAKMASSDDPSIKVGKEGGREGRREGGQYNLRNAYACIFTLASRLLPDLSLSLPFSFLVHTGPLSAGAGWRQGGRGGPAGRVHAAALHRYVLTPSFPLIEYM